MRRDEKRFCKYEGARPWRDLHIRIALSFLRLTQRESQRNLFLSHLSWYHNLPSNYSRRTILNFANQVVTKPVPNMCAVGATKIDSQESIQYISLLVCRLATSRLATNGTIYRHDKKLKRAKTSEINRRAS